jgi:hypothetical protein
MISWKSRERLKIKPATPKDAQVAFATRLQAVRTSGRRFLTWISRSSRKKAFSPLNDKAVPDGFRFNRIGQ